MGKISHSGAQRVTLHVVTNSYCYGSYFSFTLAFWQGLHLSNSEISISNHSSVLHHFPA